MPNAFWVKYQRWSVFWYSRKKKTYVRKRFYEDFGAALKFFTEHQDYPNITLHVDNHGYPPPRYITEHEIVEWERVTYKGKPYKKKVTRVVNRMIDYNNKGILWCQYCIKLRRGQLIETVDGPMMYCPVCKISHRLMRLHNPGLLHLDYRKKRYGRRTKRRRR